jgi:predicted RNA-binding Zn-ribbon protein involved in translation (DUF1610 family)
MAQPGTKGSNKSEKTEALLRRASILLEDEEWKNADGLVEQVLNIDPENARAYIYKVMAETHTGTEAELVKIGNIIGQSKDFRRAIRFASPEQKAVYESYLVTPDGKAPEETSAVAVPVESEKERVYKVALRLVEGSYKYGNESARRQAIELFESIRGFKDVDTRLAALRVVTRYCPNCGEELPKDVKFCNKCGSEAVVEEEHEGHRHDHSHGSGGMKKDVPSVVPSQTTAKESDVTGRVAHDEHVEEIKCPECGSTDLQAIVNSNTHGRGGSISQGCCGLLLLGPVGLLCSFLGSGTSTINTTYWICKKCGKQFRANPITPKQILLILGLILLVFAVAMLVLLNG